MARDTENLSPSRLLLMKHLVRFPSLAVVSIGGYGSPGRKNQDSPVSPPTLESLEGDGRATRGQYGYASMLMSQVIMEACPTSQDRRQKETYQPQKQPPYPCSITIFSLSPQSKRCLLFYKTFQYFFLHCPGRTDILRRNTGTCLIHLN